MPFLIVAAASVLFFIVVFTQFYTLSGMRVRRLMSKIPGYSEIESWALLFKLARMPIEGIYDFGKTYFGGRKVFSMWILGRPYVYLGSPSNVQALLRSGEHIKKGFEYVMFEKWLEQGLLTSTGAKWHANRKMLTPAFHFQILDSCMPVFNDSAVLLVRLLRDNCSDGQRPINIDSFISLCALDIISEAAMGVRLEAQLRKKSSLDYVSAVRRMGKLGYLKLTVFYLKSKWLYAMTKAAREEKRLLKILHGFSERVIKESKQKRQKTTSSGIKELKPTAFVDFLLEMAENNPASFTDREIRQEVDTFMFEGYETTSAAFCWTLLLLGLDPVVQERVYKEGLEVWGGSSQVPRDALGSLAYLEAVIKESLRIYPPVAFISRELERDLELEDYTVPAGANVFLSPHLMQQEPDVFQDPGKFDPERFFAGKVSDGSGTARNPFTYIPFSGGPRNCIGQRFALMEMKVVLSHIVRNFRIESVTNRDCSMCITPILRPLNGVELKLQPRI